MIPPSKQEDLLAELDEIRAQTGLSELELGALLGVSLLVIRRWRQGVGVPGPTQAARISQVREMLGAGRSVAQLRSAGVEFTSRGVRGRLSINEAPEIALAREPGAPIIRRVRSGGFFGPDGAAAVDELIAAHGAAALTVGEPLAALVSAGKNTYTYDAHTYHTKVPPQGIAELIKSYLPQGGLVFDPFAGSGMTGVAARVSGTDCILNELSPAACFIADRFVARLEPERFAAGVRTVLDELADLRRRLYSTTCRECGKTTEIVSTAWSYNVICNHCAHEFCLWDYCRRYGNGVREHRLLNEFPCPACGRVVEKARLRRTGVAPVEISYKCCTPGKLEAKHPPNGQDLELIRAIEAEPPLAEGFYPQRDLPDGISLRQPKRQGLNSIQSFYTARNRAALSHIWRTIGRVEDTDVAAHLAFAFTSLYQRVTRLSEFRFYGGSGNTARFNVPFIFNEANVFLSFARKAAAVEDHLRATAVHYSGKAVVVQNSATRLDYLPDDSVDLIFADPPFGGNIHYSEMNLLWEAWLDDYTDPTDEAIINKVQGKGVAEYGQLMSGSLRECYRVLRPGHWLLLAFMNSSGEVWNALRQAITAAGFVVRQANIFDKQHGTFEQFASANAAGCDLVLHCQKPARPAPQEAPSERLSVEQSISRFLAVSDPQARRSIFVHVERDDEIDFRSLYSEWIAGTVVAGTTTVDFAAFRAIAAAWLAEKGL